MSDEQRDEAQKRNDDEHKQEHGDARDAKHDDAQDAKHDDAQDAKPGVAQDAHDDAGDAKTDDAGDVKTDDAQDVKTDAQDAKTDDAQGDDPAAKKSGEAAGQRDASVESAAQGAPRKETWTSSLLWALGIVFILGVELFIYGHNGDVQVCVGIETLTDFELRAEPRTQANAKKHPFCAQRLNLGMWTSSDEQSQAALEDACAQAIRFVGIEHKSKCLRKDEPWTRFVVREHVMPWDPRLYRRLLWLD